MSCFPPRRRRRGGWPSDQIAAIDNWVEKGVDPANSLVVADDGGVPGRTRPMCPYPTGPRYKGSGDIHSAASYACAAS